LTFGIKWHILRHLVYEKSGVFFMLRNLLLCFVIACLIFTFGGCSDTDTNSKTESMDKTDSTPVDSLVIVLAGQEGKSVFEITEQEHELDYIPSIAGNFIQAIDSIEISSKYGWLFSVNDSMGGVASDKYITKDGDVIKWHYRKF